MKNLIISDLSVHWVFTVTTSDFKLLRLLSVCIQDDDYRQGAWKILGWSSTTVVDLKRDPSPKNTGSLCAGLVLAWVLGTNLHQKQLLHIRIATQTPDMA